MYGFNINTYRLQPYDGLVMSVKLTRDKNVNVLSVYCIRANKALSGRRISEYKNEAQVY
jgi:hypothetical protein